jgi:hypothetical protein
MPYILLSIIHFTVQYFSVLTSESHVPGFIKLALLLWDTWVSQGKFASAIFQHGTFDPPSAFCSPFSSYRPYIDAYYPDSLKAAAF